MALGVRDRQPYAGPAGRLATPQGSPASPTGPATITPVPTPEQKAEAARQTHANPVTARWNATTGQYEYVPLSPEEELKWRQTQMSRGPGVGTGVPTAPAPVTDPTAPPPAAPAQVTQQTLQQNLAAAGAQGVGQAPAAPQPARPRPQATTTRPTFDARADMPPAAPTPTAPAANPGFQPLAGDFSGVDEEMSGLRQARTDFYAELDRLSGVDPFGNQAFLQKATDRAVSQAAGTAAGARGGAAALAGANRQAVGVQAQTAARGAQEVAEAGRRDAVQAAALRTDVVKGIESVSAQLTGVEQKKVDQLTQQAEVNLRGYLGGRELDQAERDSLRNFAVQVGQIDMEKYKTDVQYRASVDANLTELAKADKALQGIMAQVQAGESMSPADWAMGIMGLGAGVAQGLAMKSDRRSKFDIHDPDMRDLQDYLGNTRGKLYRYKDPSAPGQRKGLNFGPMAQDLAKSKIGRTVVIEGKDGLYVDTGRLALADHAALAALAAEVEKLKGRAKK